MAESAKASSNIYTAMLFIALVSLIAGFVMVLLKSQELFPDLGLFTFAS